MLISGVVSLTLTPMMASRALQSEQSQTHGLLYRALEAIFEVSVHPPLKPLRE